MFGEVNKMKIAKGSRLLILIVFSAILITGFPLLFLHDNNQLFLKSLFIISCLTEVCFLLFFRDPDRRIANGIVAVADGRICDIREINDSNIGDSLNISTFMNIYNVHVNRMPIEGTIKKITYLSGGHIPAFKKESKNNERMITIIETPIGLVKIIQIAGIIARRIVNYANQNDYLSKGSRLGIIKFGSRVDLILPKRMIKNITVEIGDKVKAGENQICSVQ
jgi:phosphatidylserine decarboxylase